MRNDNPRGHYNENMKHIFWCNMAHLHGLVEEAITITSSMTGVDYNDDHKYDDATPSLLVSEPQDFIRPPSKSIFYLALMTRQRQGVAIC